jgi:pimeloyl-ACP methyl ester carboxylesterase
MKILFVLFIGLHVLASGCKKTDNQGLDDYFFLRNAGADMPIHVKSDIKAKYFLVLIHGGPGGTAMQYRSAPGIMWLEKQHAVVYWDQRGSGASRGSFAPRALTPQQIADDLGKLVLLLKEKYGNSIGIYILSHSWGAFPVAKYLSVPANSKQVAGWINCDGAMDYPASYSQAVSMMLREGKIQVDNGYQKEAWNEIIHFCRQTDTFKLSISDKKQINDYAYQIESDKLIADYAPEYGNKEVFRSYFFFSNYDVTAAKISGKLSNLWLALQSEHASVLSDIPNITQPILFIWGKYDFVVPPMQAFEAFGMAQNKESLLYLFNHSGHSPFAQQPEIFEETVYSFTHR